MVLKQQLNNAYGGDTLINIQEEIRLKILDFLSAHGIQCDPNINYTKLLLTLFDLDRKWVPPKKRIVVYSKELQEKMHSSLSEDNVELIHLFADKFSNGENINNHLSTNIYLPEQYDRLLNQWNIHHLHLNKDEAESKQDMHNNRSGTYLLFLIDNERVYFLDCVPHLRGNNFADLEFIEIVFKNKWWDVVPLVKLEGVISLGAAVRTKEDIFALWKSNVNITAFEFENEFYSVGNKVRLSGDRSLDMDAVCKLNEILSECSNDPSLSLLGITVMENDCILSISIVHCGSEKRIEIVGDAGPNCLEL